MTYDTSVTNGKQVWHFTSTSLGLVMKKALDFYIILNVKAELKPYITLNVPGMKSTVFDIRRSRKGEYYYE